ncbi:hypothetical protein [Yersinia sp. 1652 StPb PI]|uniref:hypothetical protein n=1 Tax=Yersinia sp. 1652 StPb PI TaxID=3061649 RepID=UPI00355B3D4C
MRLFIIGKNIPLFHRVKFFFQIIIGAFSMLKGGALSISFPPASREDMHEGKGLAWLTEEDLSKPNHLKD